MVKEGNSLKRRSTLMQGKTDEIKFQEKDIDFLNYMNNDNVDETDSENEEVDEEEEEEAISGEEDEAGYEEEEEEDDDDDETGGDLSDQASEQSSVGNEQELGHVMFDTENISSQPSFTSSTVSNETRGSSRKELEEDDDGKEEKPDEYEYDTSDEEDIRNTTGNVPKKWYDDYAHLGYDWDGKKILKPEQGDQLDAFLKRMEDPDFWRTVKDPQTGQDVVLSQEDIQLIQRIQAQKIPDVSFDEYAPWIEWFTSEVMKTPVRKFPEHKRSFLPSKMEAKKVSKLVHALKMGWIKTREEQAKLRAKTEPQFYMLWSTDDQPDEMRRIHKHISAPKRLLPGHAESYNPPPEYLFDKKEMKLWNKQKDTPWKRKLHFVPQKFGSLREVPSYSRYIKERFLRCLDLYLCPRAIKMKLNIEPESLVPKLPSPKDLQPFPSVLNLEYEGHKDMIRSISVDPSGQYLVSGSDDCTIKVWEVLTTRCLKTFEVFDTVHCVSWCPNTSICLVAVACGQKILLINPGVGDKLVLERTDKLLKETNQNENTDDSNQSERVRSTVKWIVPEEEHWEKSNIRVEIQHFKTVTRVVWHARGDYFASVMPDGQNRSVVINQLSKRRSQLPFTRSKGLVQCVLFHPSRPYFFVATQKNIRVYDLSKQELIKKLLSNSRWISCMAIHPGGDNLLVGTYDRKMLWFDLDLSTKPYQTLRLHGTAVRNVAFHPRYPLFASGSDDRSLIISHGMVYNDLLQNPLIVPLKRLQDHKQANDFGIFDVVFHPSQPWVFTSGADATIKLYSN